MRLIIHCCMQQQQMQRLPSKVGPSGSSWQLLLQPSGAPAEAALNCVCRPQVHKGTAARALSRGGLMVWRHQQVMGQTCL